MVVLSKVLAAEVNYGYEEHVTSSTWGPVHRPVAWGGVQFCTRKMGLVLRQDFPSCQLLTFNGMQVQSLRQLRQMAMAGAGRAEGGASGVQLGCSCKML